VAVPVAGAEAGGAGRVRVSGKVARVAAASPVGKYRGPLCPQPASMPTTPAARRSRAQNGLAKIWKAFNMMKL
jgi:hypothetical protein